MSRMIAAIALAVSVAAAARADVTVSAAASLQNAFVEIGKFYEAANPGVKVSFNFGASGQLLQQIAQGAPADVLATADVATMDKAEAQKLIVTDTRAPFASNTLVLVAPAGSGTVTSLEGLRRPVIKRIALGTPDSVPAGSYAKSALDAAGLWEALKPRYVFGQNVRQVLDYVARGEVDAGFVYATDAALMKDKVRVVATVPVSPPILYPIAVVKGSTDDPAARRFVELVRSDAGRTILARFGFAAP